MPSDPAENDGRFPPAANGAAVGKRTNDSRAADRPLVTLAGATEQLLADSDQTSSDSDQTLSDADQTGEQAADARDLAMAQLDAASAQHDGARALTGAEVVVRAAGQRKRAAQYRAQAAEHRALAAADRQAGAREREQAARERVQALADLEALAAELEHAAVDTLTGARARAAGLTDLDHELDRARRTGSPLVVAYVDVVGLKTLNDSQGHSAGDELLGRVVALIRAHLRSYDLIIRVGGDEFVCAMSRMTLPDARKRFSQVAAALAGVPDAGGIWTGFAQRLTDDDTADELIMRADNELVNARAEAPGRSAHTATPQSHSYRETRAPASDATRSPT